MQVVLLFKMYLSEYAWSSANLAGPSQLDCLTQIYPFQEEEKIEFVWTNFFNNCFFKRINFTFSPLWFNFVKKKLFYSIWVKGVLN